MQSGPTPYVPNCLPPEPSTSVKAPGGTRSAHRSRVTTITSSLPVYLHMSRVGGV